MDLAFLACLFQRLRPQFCRGKGPWHMEPQRIEPHRITKPIQLMAVWFVALLSIITALLIAAAKIHEPKWLCPALVISAICFVPLFLLGVFLMQTVFRKELQEDQYYSEWLQKHDQVFKGFKPENLPVDTATAPTNLQPLEAGLEPERVKRYEAQKGLFLVHSWRPSLTRGQVADIVIWVHQHGKGPLTHGSVDRVEYELGPKFFNKPHVKRNCHEQFKLEVSAYGPMLCLACIHFNDETPPILLDRYIDFDEPPAAPKRRVVSSRITKLHKPPSGQGRASRG